MPQPASTRLALIGPTGDADAVALGDNIINAIIAQLEAVGAAFQQGTSRPSATAGLQGYFYIHTGTGLLSYCTGSVWLDFQPYDTDLAAIAALSTTTIGRSLLAAADATALRTIIGTVIGTDVQAHDSDLDAIAALTTTSTGRSLLTAADAAALRTILALGTAATSATAAFDAAGAAAAAQAASQPLDSDLTAIAALATTSFGRSLLTPANAGAALAALGAAASDLSNVEGAWTGFAFSGVFGNFGGSERNAQYRKIGTTVQLRGLARVNSSTFAFPVTMGVMPSGYRPTAIDRFNCLSYNGSQIMTVSVYIDTSGNVVLDGNASTISSNGGMTGATGNWVNLADIQFSTA